ncbi:hypothetical protein P5673_014708 [Acropora cervicornis]|uniref:Uncharacterized protein n=1 Tax=Acropora cervicornis TaxID=6130 RepID=A0AAD9V5V9_ACRCE|nr:hypothetical protein P5673_014708 [Acropora cervicornis]
MAVGRWQKGVMLHLSYTPPSTWTCLEIKISLSTVTTMTCRQPKDSTKGIRIFSSDFERQYKEIIKRIN